MDTSSLTANIFLSLMMVFASAVIDARLALLMAVRKQRRASLLWISPVANACVLICFLIKTLTSPSCLSWSGVSIYLWGIGLGLAAGFSQGRMVKISVGERPGTVRVKRSFRVWLLWFSIYATCGLSFAVVSAVLGAGPAFVWGIILYFFADKTGMWWFVALESRRVTAPEFLAEAKH
jgi:short chain dehydrogenase